MTAEIPANAYSMIQGEQLRHVGRVRGEFLSQLGEDPLIASRMVGAVAGPDRRGAQGRERHPGGSQRHLALGRRQRRMPEQGQPVRPIHVLQQMQLQLRQGELGRVGIDDVDPSHPTASQMGASSEDRTQVLW